MIKTRHSHPFGLTVLSVFMLIKSDLIQIYSAVWLSSETVFKIQVFMENCDQHLPKNAKPLLFLCYNKLLPLSQG